MINFKTAKDIASKYYTTHGEKTISKVLESDNYWTFFARKDGKVQFGGGGICIDKADGKITQFALPSQKGFEILDSSKEVINWEER